MKSEFKENKQSSIQSLNDTRAKFHELVKSLNEDETRMQSRFTKRSISGVVAHILISTEKAYPMLLKKAKSSKPMPSFFGTKLGHYFSYQYSEYVARKLTKKSLILHYDEAHDRLEKLIQGIENNEWTLSTTLPKPNNRTLTILEIFTQQIPGHFKTHYDEIKKTIDFDKKES